ncbi:hypothetical protein LTR27_006042 [Elasticomyces elasticus]|nr:hypothetical protein LTR27_006042 [Elasticomyces elasticus]
MAPIALEMPDFPTPAPQFLFWFSLLLVAYLALLAGVSFSARPTTPRAVARAAYRAAEIMFSGIFIYYLSIQSYYGFLTDYSGNLPFLAGMSTHALLVAKYGIAIAIVAVFNWPKSKPESLEGLVQELHDQLVNADLEINKLRRDHLAESAALDDERDKARNKADMQAIRRQGLELAFDYRISKMRKAARIQLRTLDYTQDVALHAFRERQEWESKFHWADLDSQTATARANELASVEVRDVTDKCNASLAFMKKDLEAANAKLGFAGAEALSEKARADGEVNRVAMLTEEALAQKLENEKKDAELKDVRAECEKLEASNKIQAKKIEELIKRPSADHDDLEKKTTELQELGTLKSTLEASNATLIKEAEESAKSVKKLEKQLKTATTSIEAANSKADASERELAIQKRTHNVKLKSLVGKNLLDVAREEIVDLKANGASLEKSVQWYMDNAEVLKDHIENLEGKIMDLEEEVKKSNGSVHSGEKLFQEAKKEYDAIISKGRMQLARYEAYIQFLSTRWEENADDQQAWMEFRDWYFSAQVQQARLAAQQTGGSPPTYPGKANAQKLVRAQGGTVAGIAVGQVAAGAHNANTLDRNGKETTVSTEVKAPVQMQAAIPAKQTQAHPTVPESTGTGVQTVRGTEGKSSTANAVSSTNANAPLEPRLAVPSEATSHTPVSKPGNFIEDAARRSAKAAGAGKRDALTGLILPSSTKLTNDALTALALPGLTKLTNGRIPGKIAVVSNGKAPMDQPSASTKKVDVPQSSATKTAVGQAPNGLMASAHAPQAAVLGIQNSAVAPPQASPAPPALPKYNFGTPETEAIFGKKFIATQPPTTKAKDKALATPQINFAQATTTGVFTFGPSAAAAAPAPTVLASSSTAQSVQGSKPNDNGMGNVGTPVTESAKQKAVDHIKELEHLRNTTNYHMRFSPAKNDEVTMKRADLATQIDSAKAEFDKAYGTTSTDANPLVYPTIAKGKEAVAQTLVATNEAEEEGEGEVEEEGTGLPIPTEQQKRKLDLMKEWEDMKVGKTVGQCKKIDAAIRAEENLFVETFGMPSAVFREPVVQQESSPTIGEPTTVSPSTPQTGPSGSKQKGTGTQVKTPQAGPSGSKQKDNGTPEKTRAQITRDREYAEDMKRARDETADVLREPFPRGKGRTQEMRWQRRQQRHRV